MTEINEVKPTDDYSIEIFEEDYKTSKDKIRQALSKKAEAEGYNSIEEFAADFIFKTMTKEGNLGRSEDILLKYIRFIGDAEGWTTTTKEFTINSNIPRLDKKSLTSL